jgi:alkaline phosphatase D
MRDEQLDAVMFLGDYIYEYGAQQQGGAPGTRAQRHHAGRLPQRYALYKSDPDCSTCTPCPWLMTWDDHEVHNDYAGLQAGVFGPEVSQLCRRRVLPPTRPITNTCRCAAAC